MNSSESAELVVKMYLEGMQVVAKVTGVGAKNIAAFLLATASGKTKTKGKISLNKMLKSGKPLKVFSIKNVDLEKFTKEAKKYGILFNVIKDKDNTRVDGLVDVMVRAEDAPKINRIVDRFKLATVDTATIKNEIQKSKEEKEKNEDSNLDISKKKSQSKTYSKSTNNSKNDIDKKESVKKKIEDIEKELNTKKQNEVKPKVKAKTTKKKER